MPCRDALQRIADLLDGRLPPEAREDLERHLAGCEDCRAALAEARTGAEALADLARATAARPVRPTDVGAILDMAASRGIEDRDLAQPPRIGPSRARPAPLPLGGRLRRAAAALLMALGLAALAGAEVSLGDGRLVLALGLPGVGAGSSSADPAPREAEPARRPDLWQSAEHALLASDGAPGAGDVPPFGGDPVLDARIALALEARLQPIVARLGWRLEESDARRTEALITLLERQAADNARALELVRRASPFDLDQPAILMPVSGPARRLRE